MPSLPALTFKPETTNSKYHKPGFFCHSTNPPTSQLPLACTSLTSPCRISDPTIFTCPTAYMLFIEFNAACPPIAAMYCCTMYLAVEASYSYKQIICLLWLKTIFKMGYEIKAEEMSLPVMIFINPCVYMLLIVSIIIL